MKSALAWLFVAVLSTWSALACATVPASRALAPSEAFKIESAEQVGNVVTLRMQIAPGHYLYKSRLSFSGANDAAPDSLGTPRFSPAESHVDPFFGKQEIFRDTMTVQFAVKGLRPPLIVARVQGCSESPKICYPPTELKVPVLQTKSHAELGVEWPR